jgi:phosphatidylinositol alpha-1,6-mannosyltransferase
MIDENTPVLITLAALEERKGIQWVLQSIPYLLDEYPDLQYWVFGEGAFGKELQAEIVLRGLEKNVKLHGSIDDVVPFLAASDIGCLLSYGESFGIAILEYMAMELPVVASKHPPFETLIQPGWGILVDEKQPESIAQEIKTIISDQPYRQSLGRRGREQVVKNYSWVKAAGKYRKLLVT